MTTQFLHRILEAALRPAVRLCLRQGLYLQDLIEAAKTVFVEEGEQHLERAARRVTTSQLSLMTGLQRKDVDRVRERERGEPAGYPQGLLTRVVGQWLYDPRFASEPGVPAVLPLASDERSFRELVSSISSDVNPGTVLKELLRLGQVAREGEVVRLTVKSFTPRRDADESLRLYAADGDDLLHAVEENISGDAGSPHLHAKTEYDNIGEDSLPEIRKWFIDEGMALHRRARDFLSRLDHDVGCGDRPGGRRFRVALGTFSFMEPHEPENGSTPR